MKANSTKTGYELKAVLDQEVMLLENLLQVMRAEHEMLLNSATAQLFEMNKSKELLILQHSYLDRNRRKLTERLAEELGLTNSEPQLATLVDMVHDRLKLHLSERHELLHSLTTQIQQLGMENSALLECSIRAVKDSWGMLKRQFFDAPSRSESRKDSATDPLIQARV